MTEKYISFRKAGEMLGVSKDTVRAYVYKGILIAEGEWGNKKILLSSVYNHLKDIDKQAEREVGERLKLINLKLTFLDILSYYKLPITVAYMYEDRLKELVGFPEDQQRKELVKIAQEAIEMDGAVFYSYKPYLQIALTRECIVTFNENGVYIAKTPEEEKLLREYAKNTRNSYNIIEAGGELEHEDLIRLHEEDEQKLIAEAKQREKARAEEKRRKKEQHDFYDLLRM